jgi:zinc finger CCCH domain-containing protein 13
VLLSRRATWPFRWLRCSFLLSFLVGAGPSPCLLPPILQQTDMDPETANQPTKPSPKSRPKDLAHSMSKVNLDDEHEETVPLDKRNTEQSARHLVIYPRLQVLKLSKSPLVKPPEGMPALKDWFGYGFYHICGTSDSTLKLTHHHRLENEQGMHKKEGEGSSPTGARDRRFVCSNECGLCPLTICISQLPS